MDVSGDSIREILGHAAVGGVTERYVRPDGRHLIEKTELVASYLQARKGVSGVLGNAGSNQVCTGEEWYRGAELNRQPTAYETAALTVELPRHGRDILQSTSARSTVFGDFGRSVS